MTIILAPSEPRVIRFGVGTASLPTSFVWRLWITRKDTYLAPTWRNEPKFSMHGDVWKLDAGTARHSFAPIECSGAPGWIQGPAVMFCHVPYDPAPPPAALIAANAERRSVRWFPMPAEWHTAEFVVFLGRPELGPDAVLPLDRSAGSEPCGIGPLQFGDGRQVWVRHQVRPIPDDRRDYLLAVRASTAGFKIDQAPNELHVLATVMHLQGSTVVAVPLGRDSIRTR